MNNSPLSTNEIVKYDNFLNTIPLNGFTSLELDILMVLCQRVRDKEDSLITIPFTDLRRLIALEKNLTVKEFEKALDKMNQKLCQTVCHLRTEHTSTFFVLFPTFSSNFEERTLTVRVNEDFTFILNHIDRNFTRFELGEFTMLKSKYAKNLYRQLKQFRHTGSYLKTIGDFRLLMDCPKSYSNKIFIRDCVKPAIEELIEFDCFEDLEFTTIKSHQRGAPISSINISFKAEGQVPGQMTLLNYVSSEPKDKRRKSLLDEELERLLREN